MYCDRGLQGYIYVRQFGVPPKARVIFMQPYCVIIIFTVNGFFRVRQFIPPHSLIMWV